jgi:hypothetical protein
LRRTPSAETGASGTSGVAGVITVSSTASQRNAPAEKGSANSGLMPIENADAVPVSSIGSTSSREKICEVEKLSTSPGISASWKLTKDLPSTASKLVEKPTSAKCSIEKSTLTPAHSDV